MNARERRRAVDHAMNELAVAHLIYVQHRDNDWSQLTDDQIKTIKSRIYAAHRRVAGLAITHHITKRDSNPPAARSEG